MIPAFPPDGPFDCRSCGACCIAAGPVAVSPDDVQVPRHRTRSVRRMVGFASYEADDGVRCMKSDDGRCAALKGQPGVDVACAIYDRRPTVCADFQPGSAYCREARGRVRTRLAAVASVPSSAGRAPLATGTAR